jgi:hypothetical protein
MVVIALKPLQVPPKKGPPLSKEHEQRHELLVLIVSILETITQPKNIPVKNPMFQLPVVWCN